MYFQIKLQNVTRHQRQWRTRTFLVGVRIPLLMGLAMVPQYPPISVGKDSFLPAILRHVAKALIPGSRPEIVWVSFYVNVTYLINLHWNII